MNVLVVGGLGNMGRRYCAILRHLGHTPIVLDPAGPDPEPFDGTTGHVIVATPTDTHLGVLSAIIDRNTRGLHILCEKPVVKTPSLLAAIYDIVDKKGHALYCVNQYAHHSMAGLFTRDTASGDTTYDFYHSGNDGLHWDCFQLYALARGKVTLKNESPIWKCKINGVNLNPGVMDRAYVDMIKDFLGPKEKVWGKDIVVKTTEKILSAL